MKIILYSLAAALFASVSQTALAQERPAAFVDAATVVPGLIVDARYAGSHNFVGRPIAGYEAARCLLPNPPPRRSPRWRAISRRAASCLRRSTVTAQRARWRISSVGRVT